MLKNISLVCCTHSWNIFQHLRSNKFEIFMLWNAISSLLRRQFMSKMFAIINCHFYAYYYFHGLLLKYLILFYILDIIFSKCTLVLFWVYKYHKNSFENIRCQNWDFSYPDCILVVIQDFQANGKIGMGAIVWTCYNWILLFQARKNKAVENQSGQCSGSCLIIMLMV